MTTIYRLTTAEDRSKHGDLQWGGGFTHSVEGDLVMCEHGLHGYESPLVAAFMDPIHGDYGADAHLWRCEAEIVARDGPLKVLCRKQTTLERVPLPVLSPAVRTRAAIYCARAIPGRAPAPRWDAWVEAEAAEAAVAVAKAHPALDLHAIIERAIRDEGAA